MSFSLNKIHLIGNIGNDAEIKDVGENEVTRFSLATTHSFKKNDEWINETTWHYIVAWNLPDFIKNGLKKGKKWFCEGRLSKRDWTDKNGIKQTAVEVISEKLIPLEYHESKSNEPDIPEINNSDEDDLPF